MRSEQNRLGAVLAAALLMVTAPPLLAAEETVTVNADNFPHAETDMQISRMLKQAGGDMNKWTHNRVSPRLLISRMSFA